MATQCHTRVVAKLIAQHLLKRFLLLLLITRRPLAPPLRIFLPLLGSRRLRPCRCHRRRPTSGRLRLCGSCLRRRGCCCCCSCCGCCYGRFLLPCAILRPLDLQMALLAASCVDLTSQNACTRYPCGFLLRFSVAALSLSRQKPQHWPRQFWQFWQFCLRRGARRGGGGVLTILERCGCHLEPAPAGLGAWFSKFFIKKTERGGFLQFVVLSLSG
jgi:hypothetical protein